MTAPVFTDGVTPLNAATFNALGAEVNTKLAAPAVVNGQWIKGVGGAAVWAAITPADIAGYPGDGTKELRGDGTWGVAGSAANNLGLNASGATVDLAGPTGTVNYYTFNIGGGAIRSIGLPPQQGMRITLKNTTAASFVTLRHLLAGGIGKTLSIIGNGDKYLAPGQDIDFVYDGTNWQEVGRPAQELICDLTLAAPQAAIDTNTILGGNIPAVYNSLLLECVYRSATVAGFDVGFIQFNNDAGPNYHTEGIYTDSGTAINPSSGVAFGTTSISTLCAAANSPASAPTIVSLKIPSYAATTFFKACVQSAGAYWQTTTNFRISNLQGLWLNAAAINRIKLSLNSGANLVTGSRFTLWGIT